MKLCSAGAWCFALLFAVAQTQTDFGKTYDGEGTYYTLTGVGNCGFEFTDAKALGWSTGIDTFVAINKEQYAASATCGLCLSYQGTGEGIGLAPIPTTPQYALVQDQV